MTIQSWRSREAREVFEGKSPKGFPSDLLASTRRRLATLNAATEVRDLATPPGNRLHELGGDRAGEWSISINDQFRITFRWTEAGPEDVWFGDYH